ncbi:hypothetical protein [Xenorhabdus innexi]|uniref:Uncharacterized protein n=1 Tax=Xenorhabdus innexi TaxID=290109 RepID=A0A1N6N217_9GAMM|nr:hypothetical protein [Xenorhabdus innexi]PHM37147.1 hypothetical protein Xinn_01114 [Xenorhabdus innexi]SIP75072.1 conserved hypothetical protein [Xenorhabdus innexi]
MAKHIHADLMMKAAEIAQTDAEWWKYFQVKTDYGWGGWRDLGGETAFYDNINAEYRLKPRTIRIGEYDVPEPVREALKKGQAYYFPNIEGSDEDSLYWKAFWTESTIDNTRLKNRLIHLTQEAAELHAKALIALILNNVR